MSPAVVDIASQEECVPPCLFPASSFAQNEDRTAGISTEELVIEKDLSALRSTLTDNLLDLPTTLQTAWALTLRCFVPSDILCFAYKGEDAVDSAESETPHLVIGRVDNTETLAVCLQRFSERSLSPTLGAPSGYEINLVAEEPSRELCNTSLLFQGLKPSSIELDAQTDLSIGVFQPSSNGLSARIAFRRDVISTSIATSVLHTFSHVVSQILTGPHNREADLCSGLDKGAIQLLTQTVSPAQDRCLHELILDQCRAHPERMAVRSWDGDLTYGELDDLSLRLAHHLVQLGVGPEKFVLSCFEKSTWAIVARLAILRAGGAYISIFATNPPVFLDSVVRRTNPQVLLSEAKFASRFQHLVPNFVSFTPEWLRSLPSGNKSTPCESVRSDNACLVLFTSGSTGQPKGIIQVHQSYGTAIKDYAQNFRLGSDTRYLHFDDYAFDISNLEFLVPLILGGCCCVPPPMKTAEDLAAAINTLDANITFLTPTVAIKLDPADVPGLKTICVGGEPLPKELIRKWETSTTRLVNQFGMGEVAICCAYNDNIQLERGATIGRPATGAIWIVDASTPERLLPLGAVGELVIEGPHLSRRYLDNTAISRTAAGFLQKTPRWMSELHPSRSTARMYRSGDLGRLNHDGTIDYIGRKDTILKLDGCRIDAVEVEHQARKCLSPRDAIVIDLFGAIDGHEDPRLTALLYLDDHPLSIDPIANGEPIIIDAADDHLAQEKVDIIQHNIAQVLPTYMVPTVFLLMSWFPRTASKKTDRKKIRHVGQKYYMAERDKRSKSPYYAMQAQQLPK
ncbi:hypothetical protein ASPCAL05040 [Aspergillus calidoustus]|uniref:AMP-dependent synthetase/ligase domain-containing protein n=1 Tax=Aspergillus calidoustus TaxID=454130 RepID=A0A0U5FZT6_ASPCI|nr:hypothetical protein ASPCAL05040 [Aspergillus calidoustus]